MIVIYTVTDILVKIILKLQSVLFKTCVRWIPIRHRTVVGPYATRQFSVIVPIMTTMTIYFKFVVLFLDRSLISPETKA